MRQAVAAGVKHVSFTGSIAAVLDVASPVIKAPPSDTDWNPYTVEDALTTDSPFVVYCTVKSYSEKALWKFAEEHPELNLTTSEHS